MMPHYEIYRHYVDGRFERCGGIAVKPHRRARQNACETASRRFGVRPGGWLEVVSVRTPEQRRWVEEAEAEKLTADAVFCEFMTA